MLSVTEKSPICVMARETLLCQGLLVAEVSRSHSVKPQSVGLLWASDQSDAETCT